ncbi:MAG TPA: hypothetical protein DC001_07420 [Clostridiales bacterium]|nr:hypothetical protein [Clostridiales bacterium]HBR09196.1 hypothetical protein [Clostridiales bacterium]
MKKKNYVLYVPAMLAGSLLFIGGILMMSGEKGWNMPAGVLTLCAGCAVFVFSLIAMLHAQTKSSPDSRPSEKPPQDEAE